MEPYRDQEGGPSILRPSELSKASIQARDNPVRQSIRNRLQNEPPRDQNETISLTSNSRANVNSNMAMNMARNKAGHILSISSAADDDSDDGFGSIPAAQVQDPKKKK